MHICTCIYTYLNIYASLIIYYYIANIRGHELGDKTEKILVFITSHGEDVIMRVDTGLSLDHEHYREAIAVPAKATINMEASRGLVAGDGILDGVDKDMTADQLILKGCSPSVNTPSMLSVSTPSLMPTSPAPSMASLLTFIEDLLLVPNPLPTHTIANKPQHDSKMDLRLALY